MKPNYVDKDFVYSDLNSILLKFSDTLNKNEHLV